MDGGAWWAAVHGVAKSRTWLSDFNFTFHFSLSCFGEGNGYPLQCSCLENPRDGGAWWAAVYGVAQSRTRLKQLSSSSNCILIFSFITSEFFLEISYFYYTYSLFLKLVKGRIKHFSWLVSRNLDRITNRPSWWKKGEEGLFTVFTCELLFPNI